MTFECASDVGRARGKLKLERNLAEHETASNWHCYS